MCATTSDPWSNLTEAPLESQAVEGGYRQVGTDGAFDHDGRTLPGALVDDIDQLKSARPQ